MLLIINACKNQQFIKLKGVNMTTYSETIKQIKGHDVKIEFWYDDHFGAPWVEHDGHGEIRESSSRYGRPDKKPGEVIIHQSRGNYWLYDFAGAVKKAKSEGWGIEKSEGLTPNQVAEAAARADLNYCRGWLQDDWHWAGYTVTLLDEGGKELDWDSCGGMESCGDYLKKSADEAAESLVVSFLDNEAKAREAEAREAEAREYWASRDIVTV